MGANGSATCLRNWHLRPYVSIRVFQKPNRAFLYLEMTNGLQSLLYPQSLQKFAALREIGILMGVSHEN